MPGNIALKLHNYQNTAQDCDAMTIGLYRNGWRLEINRSHEKLFRDHGRNDSADLMVDIYM